MFAREGYPFILGAAAIAALAFVLAVRVRAWPLWLVALLLTIVALGVAWFFRNPERLGERGPAAEAAPVNGKSVRVAFDAHTIAGETVIADLAPA